MKYKLLLLIIVFANTLSSFAQDFITTWQTINGLQSIGFNVTTTGPVSYSWQSLPPAAPSSGSGIFNGPNVTISGLPANGRIQLTIQPTNFKRIVTTGSPFNFHLEKINQWGSVEWTSMENAFNQNQNLQVTATDIPNLSNVTSCKSMFEGCALLNSPFNINFWDMSNVTNISEMFKGCGEFNQALSLWNTTNVSDISSLFEGARKFNQNIGNWNTSNVTNMAKVFKDAYDFNRNIGTWNTSNVTDMSAMFSGPTSSGFLYSFNQNIGNWNISNVTNLAAMFNGSIAFNQNISNWDTANVTDMSDMFNQAFSFDQNIGNWDTSNVTTMARMFANDFINFNFPANSTALFTNGGSASIENWNTSNVTDMSRMFFRAENFNYNLGGWSLNQEVILIEMLDRSGLDCKNYSQTVIGWNENPSTPNNKVLGATFMAYGPQAQSAINNLVFNKGWGFSGHDLLSVVPQFNFNTTYCEGSLIEPFPTVSEDGVPGFWTPQVNSDQTTTYTFVPEAGQCATTATITLTITPIATPSGESNQSFIPNSVLSDIVISPSNVLWYASLDDAIANENPLSSNTLLENGSTYFAVNDNGSCRSQAFPVTVSTNLNVNSNDRLNFTYFPNPVSAVLTIVGIDSIKQVEIYNLMGQLLRGISYDSNTVEIDLSDLPKSIYMVKVKSATLSKDFKIVTK